MATTQNTHTQGAVKDPEHDGRLKENREAGRTKETTPGSKARAEGHPQEPAVQHETKGSHANADHAKTQPAQATHAKGAEGGDLKSREYTDKDGTVHHHTRKNSG